MKKLFILFYLWFGFEKLNDHTLKYCIITTDHAYFLNVKKMEQILRLVEHFWGLRGNILIKFNFEDILGIIIFST